ncbi:hypothetical protein SAMN05216548_11229 [Faunimonas pinastri]|uniref:Imelysin-like domain-containing protein n=1 Tax=Faunimonas pinastri TaxID=1855383 RepID=A0A1H9LV32_9HYPH|nr:imelysin family protein [Faunimonas pinastri]SER15208.1 hypothetical protein SAMN05216548_11229 [Faunimonas pinastri]
MTFRSIIIAVAWTTLGIPAAIAQPAPSAQPAAPQAPAPAASAAAAIDYMPAVTQAIDGYILPAYRDLQADAGKLADDLGAYCAAPDPTRREALKAGMTDLVKAFAGVDFMQFGPMAQGGRLERFSFWPDPHGVGARQIRMLLARPDPAILQPGALAKQSVALQGIPALEALLYGTGGVLTSDSADPFRCRLAEAIGRNLVALSGEIVMDWTKPDGWRARMLSPGPQNSVYRAPAEPMTEVLKAELTGLEQLADQRIAPAIGDAPATARPALAPYAASGNALAYYRASKDALKRLSDASGMLKLLPADHRFVVRNTRDEWANLDDAFAHVTAPDLKAAVADQDQHDRLAYSVISLQSLRTLYQQKYAPAVGLSVGFNALDGD